MKRVLHSLIIGILLALPSSLFAYYRPCSQEIMFAAEWLYMLQGLDQPNFVIDGEGYTDLNVIGEREANEQSWKSGYRLEFLFGLCNLESSLALRWTHLPTFSNTSAIGGTSLFNTIAPPSIQPGVGAFNGTVGEASITDKFDFCSFEALYRQHLVEKCGFDTGLYFGLQYAKIELDESYSLSTTLLIPSPNPSVEYRSTLWGIGPEIGAEFSLQLPCCILATARCHGALLASKRKASLFGDIAADVNVPIYDVEDEDYWTVVPTTDVRMGLFYEWCLNTCDSGCWSRCAPLSLQIEVGYEFISYYDAITRIRFDDNRSIGNSYNEQIDFHLHGPYVHIGLTF